MKNRPIILVLGRLCSGKGTFCSTFINPPHNYFHVTTSDVVKQITGLQTRSKLQETKLLDFEIAEQLIAIISQHPKIIIDGIRQEYIINELIVKFGLDNIELVWLEVPEEIRKRRFYTRQDSKDDRSFEQAEQGDFNLGLLQVEYKYKNVCKIVSNI